MAELPVLDGSSLWEAGPADEARQRTREHVRALARLIDGEQVAIVRTTSFGARLPDVEALSGLEAAVRVRDVAMGLVRDYAIAARAEGACWATVGAALGLGELVERTGEDMGGAAFLFVAGVRMPEVDGGWSSWRSSVGWTCATCGARVTDHGPFDAHPDESEPGHAKHCGRRVRALARLRAAWNDDTDDQSDDQSNDRAVDDQDSATGGVSGRW
jgi:hypothetical protein